MRGNVTRLSFAAALAALLVVGPLSASASLPKPSKAKIERFKSIGGVKLGMSDAEVTGKWGVPNGPANHCYPIGEGSRCEWNDVQAPYSPPEGAVVEFFKGKACRVSIRAGTSFQDGSLRITRFKKWKTDEGIGLGSTTRETKKAYGGLQDGKKGVSFTFFAGYEESAKRVKEISMLRTPCVGHTG